MNGKPVLSRAAFTALCLAAILTTAVFAASGDLDTTFSEDGKLIQMFGDAFAYGNDLAVQADGKLVVVGRVQPRYQDSAKMVILRYNTDGTLDTTFSGDGKLLISIEGWNDAQGVILQKDGKIVIVGKTCSWGEDNGCDLVVIRLNPNGTKDKTFNAVGVVRKDFLGRNNDGLRVVMQGTKIVVVGNAVSTTGSTGVVYRLLSNGAFDTTFSGDGIRPIKFTGHDTLSGIAIYSGKIYVVGTSTPSFFVFNDFITVRLNNNGSLDTTFNGTGKLKTDLGGSDIASDLVISGGKVIVAGRSAYDLAIVQYDSTGALDPTFSGDGILISNLPDLDGAVTDVALQAGNILVAGGCSYGDAFIARFTPAGELDTTFSTDGIVTTDWDSLDTYNRVVFKNSRLNVVGTSYKLATDPRIIVAAYQP